MAFDESNFSLDSVSAALQNYIVSPLNAYGLGGFIFDVAAESQAVLTSDITDHYTEDNRALQDHIAVKPKKITLKGYVGELVYGKTSGTQSIIQKAVKKLTIIDGYLPALSAAATQLQGAIANNSTTPLPLTTETNIYSVVKNLLGAFGDQSNQQNAYLYFQALQKQGILMAIQTPWEFLSNMAIETITAIQPEESVFITDFSITFKEIRIAQTLTTAYSTAATGGTPPAGGISVQGDAALQCTENYPIGIVPGVALPTNLLPGAQGTMTGVGDLALQPISNIFKAL